MRRILRVGLAMVLIGSGAAAKAESANHLSAAQIKGRELARQLCDSKPAENYTNTGILQIRGPDDSYQEIPIRIQISTTGTNWQVCYEATTKAHRVKLLVVHNDQGNQFFDVRDGKRLKTKSTDAFAGSDFWLCDLGLEFFRWPEQKVLPKITELKRGRSYMLLQSTNPHPAANGYSRVVSWIDKKTGGILEAEAYDAHGKLLKVFEPKSFKKVNGQWELQEMEIRNVQTDSRTRLKFDLKQD